MKTCTYFNCNEPVVAGPLGDHLCIKHNKGHVEHSNTCIKCGGAMIGDGFTSVEHCEYADSEEIDVAAPDEGPFYCDFNEEGEK